MDGGKWRFWVGGLGDQKTAVSNFIGAKQFITTDDRLLSKIRDDKTIKAVNPLDALACLEKWYDD